MTMVFFLFLAVGAFCGGFVNGFAGFGTSLFSLGWLLQVMPPLEAVAISICLSLVSGIQGIILVWSSIHWPTLLRWLIPALLGVPVGIALLEHLNARFLTLLVAAFLIIYGGFFAFRSQLPNVLRDMPIADRVIGFISGILGAVAGLSGALPTIVCSMRPWPKMQQRALLQPFNGIILGVSALMLYFQDAFSQTTISSLLIAAPITFIAAFIGIRLFKMVSDNQFRRLLIFMMLLSGVVLLLRVYGQ